MDVEEPIPLQEQYEVELDWLAQDVAARPKLANLDDEVAAPLAPDLVVASLRTSRPGVT